jgi:hypothetical protein
MLQIYRRAAGAALFALTFAPVAALAEDASAVPPQGLVSFLPAPSGPSQPADSGKLGVSIASLPSDAMVPPPPLPTDRGFYISADGSGQSVSLPTVNLGFANTTGFSSTPPFLYNGATASHNPTATGAGVDLAFGYFLPPGTVSPSLGNAPRVELDFSLLEASQQQSSFLAPTGGNDPLGGNAIAGLMLNGTVINDAPICNIPGITCAMRSTESTDYMTWHLAAKVASDFPLGGLMTATPSLSLIGGEGNNDTSVNQAFQQFIAGAPFISQAYLAKAHLNWNDIGGKAGLTLKAPLSSWVTASVAGSVALVDRDTSLRGSDMYTGTFPGGIPLPAPPQTCRFLARFQAARTRWPCCQMSKAA